MTEDVPTNDHTKARLECRIIELMERIRDLEARNAELREVLARRDRELLVLARGGME